MSKIKNEAVQRLIEFFGSQMKLADALDVEQSAVSGWLNNRFYISRDNADLAESLTNGVVRSEELRPRKKTKTPSDN
ncbi:transcriptional regulator [Moraxella catarrhalis]|uniref:transcriptional regulator n=1 Tax=Moraxella catarrhalis TaxID=480 RepID=UPI0007E37EF4|nr:Cro/CI family transcriptional regulator [Moraxella catarrhalis]OAV07005.1 hypothetical protein AO381_0160 [Moraxella catarrhalis]